MKKILVPTDFSGTSKEAYLYARELAKKWDAKIEVVHFFLPEIDPAYPYLNGNSKEYIEEKAKTLKKFKNHTAAPNDGGIAIAVDVESKIIVGYPSEELVKLSNDPEIDLIIMGTTGAGKVLNKLFGSVSSYVARRANCPVLLVPKGAKFKQFRNVLYASNYESTDSYAVNKVKDLATFFQSNVHFIHVEEENEIKNFMELEGEIFDTLFENGEPNFAFYMSVIRGESVEDSLNEYINNNEIDLTVMVCPHRNFWDNIFHKSHTKTMAMKTQVPILVYHTDM